MPGLIIDTVLGAMRSGMATEVRNDHNKGWFANATALRAAWPTALVGDFATVGSGAGGPSVWSWDSGIADWEDTASSGLVTSVFGRTGVVAAQVGDYAAHYDAIGAAAAGDSAHLLAFDHTKIHTQGTDLGLDTGGANAVTAATIVAHHGNTSNPHSVTYTQVGADATGTAAAAISAHLLAYTHSDIALNTAARHAQSHALSGTDHSGLLAATQMPASGTWTIATASVMTFAPTDATSRIDITCPVSMSTAGNNTVITIQEIAGVKYLVPAAQILNSQLPLGGNWALTSGLVINSAFAIADFTVNRKTSGKAIYYNATDDVMDGDFFACTSAAAGTPIRHVSLGHGAKKTAYCVHVGYNAGNAGSSGQNVCVGDAAGANYTGSTSVYVGRQAGQNSGSGGGQTYIGAFAGENATGQLNTAVGNGALRGAATHATSQVVAVGNGCLGSVTGANYAVAIGNSAGSSITTSRNFILLGYNAGDFETTQIGVLHIDGYGNDSPRVDIATGRQHAIIYGLMTAAGRSTQTLALNAAVTIARGLTVNDDAAALDFVIKRVTSGTAFKYDGTNDRIDDDFFKRLDTSGRVSIGYGSCDVTASGLTLVGGGSGNASTSGANNSIFGYAAATALTSGAGNVIVGALALASLATGDNTIGVGRYAGNANNASNGIFLGDAAGYYETGAAKLMIDAFGSSDADEAAGRLGAIIYGVMSSTRAAQTLRINAALITPDAQYHYFGDPNTNDTWRIGRSGNNLVIERRESGSYVTKQTISA